MVRTILAFLTAVAMVVAVESPQQLKPPFIVPKPEPVMPAKGVIRIGRGTPDSVDAKRLREALRGGGNIVFDTGGQPVTILVDEPFLLGQGAPPTVIDGGGLVTFDGQGRSNVFVKEWKTDLTVQRCRFVHCRSEKNGAAIWNNNFDGSLTVIDCQFEDCKTTAKGPDIGGGAICVRGQRPMLISNCSFKDCAASNGGAINTIQCEVYLIDCSFEGCNAFGTGGGAERQGQGGIGGAVYCDSLKQGRDGWEYFIAGCLFRNNSANDHAGAMFAYEAEERNDGHVFWNCHFEGNKVGKDASVKHAGAIYTQHSRHLWVGNCSFWDNSCPGAAGTIFTAANVKEDFLNCEFSGNQPEFSGKGDGCSFKRSQVPACVQALGRLPGPTGKEPPKKKEKPKAETKVLPAPPVTVATQVQLPTAEARAAFDARLVARVIERAKEGRGPGFLLSSMKSQALVESADARELTLRIGDTTMSVVWKAMTEADRLGLALGLAQADAAADHAQAAFRLLVAGRRDEAQAQLIQAGSEAAAVEAAFPAP